MDLRYFEKINSVNVADFFYYLMSSIVCIMFFQSEFLSLPSLVRSVIFSSWLHTMKKTEQLYVVILILQGLSGS